MSVRAWLRGRWCGPSAGNRASGSGRNGAAPRSRILQEVDDELRFHIARRAEDNERRGMSPDRALDEAERRFGDFDRITRASRRERLTPPDGPEGPRRRRLVVGIADALRDDVVYALRGFARSPGLFAAAIVTLAIGLGATTAIYGLANWLLLRPVPGVAAPDDLSTIWVGRHDAAAGSFRPWMLAYPNFEDIAERATTLTGLAGYQVAGVSAALPDGGARKLVGQVVTPAFFDVLGVEPALGRGFTEQDNDADAGVSVVVISDALWESMFRRDPDVLGRAIRLNGGVFTVVGVAPPSFRGVERRDNYDLWIAGSAYAGLRHFADVDYFATRERGWFYMLVGRRAPQTTWDQVDAELASLAAWLQEEHPDANEGFGERGFNVFRNFGTNPLGVGPLTTTLALLMGVSGLVLLIACANIANLLLIRGLGRRSETSLRKALGAGRARLLAMHLTEGAILWLLGAVAGIVAARGLAAWLEGARVAFLPVQGVEIDYRVVAFAATVALVVGLAFATIPAIAALRVGAAGSLKESASTATRRRLGARTGLTVVQLAASLTLLVGTLLLVRTLDNLSAVESGFDADGVYVLLAGTSDLGYTPERSFEYFRELVRRIGRRPEVAGVATAERAPFRCCNFYTRIRRVGEESDEAIVQPLSNTLLSPGYFELLGIPVLRGRAFTDDDIKPPGGNAAHRVVVSESLAEALFESSDVVGRRVEFPIRSRAGREYEIIGVVGDVRARDLTEPMAPTVYEPAGLDETFRGDAYVLFRTHAPFEVATVMADIGASIDSALPVGPVVSLHDAIAEARAEWTLLAKLMSMLAAFAAALAAVGLYGVVAFSVSARSRELGIRMTCGAEPGRVLRLVLRSTAGMAAAGLVLGLAGAVALARLLESRLFGVEPFDLATWVLSAAGLVAIALLATLLPARRATRVNPVDTLRSV